jgi:uncharacterized membrane protein YphA (DoxX/SURF4 family)
MINTILSAGKYIYALVFAAFGILHFVDAAGMTDAMKPPGGVWTVYISGALLIGVAICIIIGKFDKFAAVLLGLVYLIFAFTLNFEGMMAGSELSTSMFLKDVGLAGGAWMYASGLAKDTRIIGK